MMFDILKSSSQVKDIETHSFLFDTKRLNRDIFLLRPDTDQDKRSSKNFGFVAPEKQINLKEAESNEKLIQSFNDFIHLSLLHGELDFAIEVLETNMDNFKENGLLYKEDDIERGFLYHCNIIELQK